MSELREVIAQQNQLIAQLREETERLRHALTLRFERYQPNYRRLQKQGWKLILPIVVQLIKESDVGQAPLRHIRQAVKSWQRMRHQNPYADTTINRRVEELAEQGYLVRLGGPEHAYTLPEVGSE